MIDGFTSITAGFLNGSLPENTARRHFVCADMCDMWNGSASVPAWCDGGRIIAGSPAPYPFCPEAAYRRIPDEIAAAADMRGMSCMPFYPSSCVVCRYKRGYNIGLMSFFRRRDLKRAAARRGMPVR